MARYVVVEVYPAELLDAVCDAVRRKFQELLGVRIIKGSLLPVFRHKNRVVFRVTTRLLPYLRASIVLVRHVEERPVLVVSRRVTGSLRKAKAQACSLEPLI